MLGINVRLYRNEYRRKLLTSILIYVEGVRFVKKNIAL